MQSIMRIKSVINCQCLYELFLLSFFVFIQAASSCFHLMIHDSNPNGVKVIGFSSKYLLLVQDMLLSTFALIFTHLQLLWRCSNLTCSQQHTFKSHILCFTSGCPFLIKMPKSFLKFLVCQVEDILMGFKSGLLVGIANTLTLFRLGIFWYSY